MYNFHKEIQSFLKQYVALTADQKSDISAKRDRNIKRISDGLSELMKPSFVETQQQGGYAMDTMVQPPENDTETRYDIDEGIIFNDNDTKTPRTTKSWVCDALNLKGSNFKTSPYIKPKCVRVEYAAGYQCDFPVFRRHHDGIKWNFELAAGDDWVESDPKSMNDWFANEVATKSPPNDATFQLRRIAKLGKYFSKVEALRNRVSYPGGLVATALIVENYLPDADRDDRSFYATLNNLSKRSATSPVFANGIKISDQKDEARIQRLIDSASAAVEVLDDLITKTDLTDEKVRKIWKKVFRHSFFDEANSAAKASVGTSELVREAQAEANEMISSGAAERPWYRGNYACDL